MVQPNTDFLFKQIDNTNHFLNKVIIFKLIILFLAGLFSLTARASTCPKEDEIYLNQETPAHWVTDSGWISSNTTTSPDFGPKKLFYAAFLPHAPSYTGHDKNIIKGIIGPCNYTNGELEISMYPPESSAVISGKTTKYRNGAWFSDVEQIKLPNGPHYYSHYICFEPLDSCKFEFIPREQSDVAINPLNR